MNREGPPPVQQIFPAQNAWTFWLWKNPKNWVLCTVFLKNWPKFKLKQNLHQKFHLIYIISSHILSPAQSAGKIIWVPGGGGVRTPHSPGQFWALCTGKRSNTRTGLLKNRTTLPLKINPKVLISDVFWICFHVETPNHPKNVQCAQKSGEMGHGILCSFSGA